MTRPGEQHLFPSEYPGNEKLYKNRPETGPDVRNGSSYSLPRPHQASYPGLSWHCRRQSGEMQPKKEEQRTLCERLISLLFSYEFLRQEILYSSPVVIQQCREPFGLIHPGGIILCFLHGSTAGRTLPVWLLIRCPTGRTDILIRAEQTRPPDPVC